MLGTGRDTPRNHDSGERAFRQNDHRIGRPKRTDELWRVDGWNRFNINKWIAAEGDYDFSSNSQKYVTAAGNFRTQTYLHGVTGIGVVKLPALANMKPFVLAGGGALVFDPRNNASIERQTRGTFVYGGGADVRVMKHVAVRGQYRGFVYKTPDFGTAQLKTDKFTHAAVPSAGLVFRF